MTEGTSSWESLIEGNSPAMRDLREQIAACARAPDDPVLILGPTGCGKERTAKAIHRASRPEGSPFEPHTCLGPDQLAESALFGHERGAFTGAHAARKGARDIAGAGSLFLDEIGETTLAVQAKLLRFLEERTFRSVGGSTDRILRARILAATNVDLQGAMARGAFRTDLYYRLAHIVVQVPALHERREDIPELVRGFARERREEDAFDASALDALASLSWPGQVRQLRAETNSLMAKLKERPIRARHIERLRRITRLPPPNKETIILDVFREVQPTWHEVQLALDAYIAELLHASGGNVTGTARLLGRSREWLRKWIARREEN